MLSYVVWRVEPELLRMGSIVLTWYELLVATGLLTGSWLAEQVLVKGGVSLRKARTLLLCVGLTTAIGARLGYFLLTEPMFLLVNPLGILLPLEPGLSSHGAAAGFFLGLAFYEEAHRHPQQTYLWLADRLAVVVPLVIFWARLGQLMSSEAVGRPTNSLWAFVFLNYPEFPAQPRHPVPLYEALVSLLLLGGLGWAWFRQSDCSFRGRLIGFFLVGVFFFRFLIDDLKDHPAGIIRWLGLTINQLLSLPAVFVGSFLILRSYWKRKRLPAYSGRKIMIP
ncbi:prolipoprotein diacylglyceryl transferase [Larkinella sp. VNQ87]|uniref:prolipoprotein diacylglyceryl transferase n=1 Tax=Larkinella sp. VNQ87 TaxID=3400921 RepID=UPI003C0B1AEE